MLTLLSKYHLNPAKVSLLCTKFCFDFKNLGQSPMTHFLLIGGAQGQNWRDFIRILPESHQFTGTISFLFWLAAWSPAAGRFMFLHGLQIKNLNIFCQWIVGRVDSGEIICHRPGRPAIIPTIVLLHWHRNVIRKCLVSPQWRGMPARPIWWQRYSSLIQTGLQRRENCPALFLQLASGGGKNKNNPFCHHLPSHHGRLNIDTMKLSR